MKQVRMNLYKGCHGGRRPGAGRKRIHSSGVSHRVREKVVGRLALHVNFKVKTSIRNKNCFKILKKAIKNARTHGLKIMHFSLQSNHVHFIMEATSNEVLTRGMRSLTVTFAKGANRGRIQLERYHLHVLKSLQETKNAIHYVLFNEQKHSDLKKAHIDCYSSLGAIKDLSALAKSAKMQIIVEKIQQDFISDLPSGWMINQILNQYSK